MPLPSPKLDDRDFDQLVAAAQDYIRQRGSAWTDLSPSDPGMILVEVFAHLTETLIYRLNKLPDKAYIALLNLLGLRLQPPSAAAAILSFSRSNKSREPITIPRGTKVASQRADAGGETAVFITTETVTLAADKDSVEVLALHCEQVTGELLGISNGQAGQRFQVAHAPIIAPFQQDANIFLGVEITEDELKQFEERVPSIRFEGKIFHIWQAVESFAQSQADDRVYMLDRYQGQIFFASAITSYQNDRAVQEALAFIPPAKRELRVWYRYGGGDAGNVAAQTLTVLKDKIEGLQVVNQEAATGGRSAEELSNLLQRAPSEIHALNRAITAEDFETLVSNFSRQVDRVKSFNRSSLWSHAAPGTVDLFLVPYLPLAEREKLSHDLLKAYENVEVLASIATELEKRRALGTSSFVNWARYKTVNVRLRLVVSCEEDRQAVKERVLQRLNRFISPLSDKSYKGWPFGESLRASHIYDIALREPGVRWVDSLSLQLDDVPKTAINGLAADPFQPNTWYTSSGNAFYRSMNDGQGWELLKGFPDEKLGKIVPHPEIPGLLALIVNQAQGSRIDISPDCGESWQSKLASFDFELEDIAWMPAQNQPTLLLASDKGLYQLALDKSPQRLIEVDEKNPSLGFYAVTATQESNGQISVAVASQNRQGVFLSKNGGQSRSFRRIGLNEQDIRVLRVQRLGSRSFLWAGAATSGGDNPGTGCYRWELRGRDDPTDAWLAFANRWNGGSCWAITFIGEKVYAASHRGGVMILHPRDQTAEWESSNVRAGLLLRDPKSFVPMQSIASDAKGLLMVGCDDGIFASADSGKSYTLSSESEFDEVLTLAPNWLFVSGNHEVEIVCEDDLSAG